MSELKKIIHTDNIRLSDNCDSVIILDQSRLPMHTEYLSISRPEEMYDAILKLRVRGAPAIGIFAAYCMAVIAKQAAERQIHGQHDTEQNTAGLQAACTYTAESPQKRIVRELSAELQKAGEYLKSSRPTAVNLAWAVDRTVSAARNCAADADTGCAAAGDMQTTSCKNDFREHSETDLALKIAEAVKKEAEKIHQEDIAMCRAISEYGLTVIKDGDGILTHCNAGPLATSRYGTALGPLLLGRERGMNFRVFADETRPLLQGARLTSYELQKAGIDVTLICDNMASTVMKNGWIQACFVGCDRVAANGDTANKIGTSGAAILAKYYGIPFYVLGPTSTVDLSCPSGAEIPIELRSPDEIKEKFYSEPVALKEVKCYNPAFDVTDSSLITGIITEKGICRPPFTESLRRAVEEN